LRRPKVTDSICTVNVAVIGTGHVGLVTCVAVASLGHRVVGTDADREKVAGLTRGKVPFREPDLDRQLQSEVRDGRLQFVPDTGAAVPGSEVVFICVGTPPKADGEANLVAVEKAAREVARHASDGVVVAEKSTVPTGTAERLRLTISRERPQLKFDVASNPEFLREGTALRDWLEPTRILVGAESVRAFDVMRRLYKPLTRRGYPLIEVDIRTAELAKHACNAFLALKISFANALARVCEGCGADVMEIAEVMGADPRIGREFLNPGIGYGGYCFPKDIPAFARLAERVGYDFRLLAEITKINEEALDAAVRRVEEALWNLEDKRIGLLGLAYKAGTDDVRLSPALSLARRLLASGARVVGYDPVASANAKAELPELELAADPYEAASEAHCLVVCTEWKEFASLQLDRLRALMAYPVVVDGRNIFDSASMREAGFAYYPTGRPPAVPAQPWR
jgi:UDPglucose 6-dehydrogenase